MPDQDSRDRLTLTLDALRSDVERTPLADSLTVRRRGDQRTRRQAVGGALAAVAVVAGAAGIIGSTGSIDRADAPPATTGPTATTQVEQPLALAAEPLLTPDDLGAVGPYDGWQVNPDPVSSEGLPSRCVPELGTLGAAETQSRLLYGELDAGAVEHVLRFASASAAASAVETLTGAFAACDPGDPSVETVVDRGPVPVPGTSADEATHASRTGTPVLASEVSFYELGVAREVNVVVVLQWRSSPLAEVDWVWDEARLQAALDRAVG